MLCGCGQVAGHDGAPEDVCLGIQYPADDLDEVYLFNHASLVTHIQHIFELCI